VAGNRRAATAETTGHIVCPLDMNPRETVMRASVSQLLAIAVREIVPTLMQRRLSYTFAEHDCLWTLDRRERSLETSFHRLSLGASESLESGFVAFNARVRPLHSGGCSLVLRIGGAGSLQSPERIGRMLESLSLIPDDLNGRHTGETQLRRAHGICPATLARVDFACLPLAGFMFNAVYSLRDALPDPEGADASPALTQATAPRLWLLHDDPVNAASTAAQAQSNGWAVSIFASVAEVVQRLQRFKRPEARPALFISFLRDTEMAEALLALRPSLPDPVHCVAAVELGSSWLRDTELMQGYELRCHPFCQADWQQWSREAEDADQPSGLTRPAPLGQDGRLAVLVADDDELTRELTQTMLHALGYDTLVARDGSEAIERCRSDGPSVVLMDLEMPEVNGYEATRRLRTLQREGLIAPCRILAFSAALPSDSIARAHAAGVDAFIAKPAPMDTLRAELARWTAAH
jgi:CheY-like chemotaxis protein